MVAKNKTAVIDYYKANSILVLQQVHSNKIIDADFITDPEIILEADGAVTTKKKLILTVQTADCVPILLSSNDGVVIGAAHCGWRGSKAGIVNNALQAMLAKGARNIKAVIGPAIAQASYEVDQKFYDDFVTERSDLSRFFIESSNNGFYMFDLPAYVELNLREAGVEDIIKISEDTYITPDKYPSYRRSCHTDEIYNQSILSTIVIM